MSDVQDDKMMTEDELVKDLTEEINEELNNTDKTEDDTDRGVQDKSDTEDEDAGSETDDDTPSDNDDKQDTEEDKPDESEDDSEGDDADDGSESGTEEVAGKDNKRNAETRLKELLEERKQWQQEKAELQQAQLKAQKAVEDPVYTLEDFIGSADPITGEPMEKERAQERYDLWKTDYDKRQLEQNYYQETVTRSVSSLQDDTVKAFETFPEFNQNSKEYDQDLASLADDMFMANVITDTEGNVIGSKVSPYEILERIHNTYQVRKQAVKVNAPQGDGTPKGANSRQVGATKQKYEPTFQGEVDKAMDDLIKQEYN